MRDKKNLVWIDLEMTGLKPEENTILEIATVITDSELKIIAEGPVVAIRHSKERLDAMDKWCVTHHSASGLSRRCIESDITVERAEEMTLDFIKEYCPENTAPLCGNSVHQDRRFLAREMHRLNSYLHYRIIDVSSVKELVSRWYPGEFEPMSKKNSHLALNDIRESIEELSEYRKRFFRVPKAG